jgi:predicted XRE-type DNA-binding protein
MSDERVTQGSGNVVADLGMPNADELLLKAQLVAKVRTIMASRGLRQPAAAKLMGVSQPDLSRLLRGHFRDVSEGRLLKMIRRLDTEVEIVIRDHGQLVGDTIHLESLPA